MSGDVAGHWGQLPLPLPEVAEDADVLCPVAPGEAAAVVAAYERAARLADALWDELDRAGLGLEVLRVIPSLTAELRPVARVQLTRAGARLVGWLLDSGANPPSEQDGDGSRVA